MRGCHLIRSPRNFVQVFFTMLASLNENGSGRKAGVARSPFRAFSSFDHVPVNRNTVCLYLYNIKK